jgi:hypothetical protein
VFIATFGWLFLLKGLTMENLIGVTFTLRKDKVDLNILRALAEKEGLTVVVKGASYGRNMQVYNDVVFRKQEG